MVLCLAEEREKWPASYIDKNIYYSLADSPPYLRIITRLFKMLICFNLFGAIGPLAAYSSALCGFFCITLLMK